MWRRKSQECTGTTLRIAHLLYPLLMILAIGNRLGLEHGDAALLVLPCSVDELTPGERRLRIKWSMMLWRTKRVNSLSNEQRDVSRIDGGLRIRHPAILEACEHLALAWPLAHYCHAQPIAQLLLLR